MKYILILGGSLWSCSKGNVSFAGISECLTLDNLCVGVGDICYCLRWTYKNDRHLLGRGFDIDEAKAELDGVTLESLVISERVARVVKLNIEKEF